MMKTLYLVVAVMLLASQQLYAQYEMRLENDQWVSNTVYEFDVYIRSTSGTINLTSYQVFLTYNTSIANGGTLTFSYIGGTSASTVTPIVTDIYSDNGSNLGTGSSVGADGIDVTGKRLGRFRLSNTVAYPNQAANVAWDFVGSLYTVVNINSINVTASGNHTNILLDTPLPISLRSFTSRINPMGAGVRLEWTTVTEVNNYGFYVQRREEATETFVDLPNSFVAGHGTTLQPQDYSFVDNTLTKSEKYYYRLRQVDLDGTEHYSSGVLIDVSVLAVKELAPMEFKLHQNYPNPFNPEAVIKFSVESTGKTTLRVYNVLGQEVATLFEEIAEAGQYYKVRLNGTNLASGVYFYKLESGKKSDLRKMLLLK